LANNTFVHLFGVTVRRSIGLVFSVLVLALPAAADDQRPGATAESEPVTTKPPARESTSAEAGHVVITLPRSPSNSTEKAAEQPANQSAPATQGGVRSYAHEPAPYLLGAGSARPYPSTSCKPARPPWPEEAREKGISGLVLVEFVVHSDGRVGEVKLRNKNAPPILFEAVKTWLEGCEFIPAVMKATGKPVPIKLIQPFNYSFR
jgi:TonB family protein